MMRRIDGKTGDKGKIRYAATKCHADEFTSKLDECVMKGAA